MQCSAHHLAAAILQLECVMVAARQTEGLQLVRQQTGAPDQMPLQAASHAAQVLVYVAQRVHDLCAADESAQYPLIAP